MFNLILKEYTSEKIIIQAMPETTCNEFVWKGYNQNQTFETIGTTKKPSLTVESPDEFLKKYSQVICHASDKEETYISSYLQLNNMEPQSMEIIPIKSYKGFSLFFVQPKLEIEHQTIFEYRVFGTKADKTKCVATVNTFACHLPNLNYDSYYVEGYRRVMRGNEDTRILCYKSRIIKKEQLTEQSSMKMGAYDAQWALYSDLAVCILVRDIDADITETIDSALASKDCHMSVLLANSVDDPSTQKLCKWYEDNYPNIVYKDIITDDEGLLHNTAVKEAKKAFRPTYMTFLDEHEAVDPLTYKKMVMLAKNGGKDMVFTKYISDDLGQLCTIEEADPFEFYNMLTHIISHRIVKTELVEKARIPEKSEFPDEVETRFADITSEILLTAFLKSNAMCNEALFSSTIEFDPDFGNHRFKNDFTIPSIDNVLFLNLIFPISQVSNSDTKAIVHIIKGFIDTQYARLFSKDSNVLDISKASAIMKHVVSITEIEKSEDYTKDEKLIKDVNQLLACYKISDLKIFSWLVQTEYLRKNIKRA